MSSMVLEMEGDIIDAEKHAGVMDGLVFHVGDLPDHNSGNSLEEVMGFVSEDLLSAIDKIFRRFKAITEMKICAK